VEVLNKIGTTRETGKRRIGCGDKKRDTSVREGGMESFPVEIVGKILSHVATVE